MNHLTINILLAVSLFAYGTLTLGYLGLRSIITIAPAGNTRTVCYVFALLTALICILIPFTQAIAVAQEWWR